MAETLPGGKWKGVKEVKAMQAEASSREACQSREESRE